MFRKPSFMPMILLASIPSSYIEISSYTNPLTCDLRPSASAMHTSATEAAVTAAETALRSTAGASAVHGAAETAVRSASEAAAMHTSAETGLAAGGVHGLTKPPWSNPLNAPGVGSPAPCAAQQIRDRLDGR